MESDTRSTGVQLKSAKRWSNTQCAIDHWAGECRDVTPTKLQCQNKYLKSNEGILKTNERKKINWGSRGAVWRRGRRQTTTISGLNGIKELKILYD